MMYEGMTIEEMERAIWVTPAKVAHSQRFAESSSCSTAVAFGKRQWGKTSKPSQATNR